jgi:hypothetical protein
MFSALDSPITGPSSRRLVSGVGPDSDITQRLLDHLVGKRQQRIWHGQTERLGGHEVDHQFEFGWLQNREVGRLVALENAAT